MRVRPEKPIRLSGPPPPGAPDGWEWDRIAPTPDQLELVGLGVMVTVLERMSPGERHRALVYLVDRYGNGEQFGEGAHYGPTTTRKLQLPGSRGTGG